MGAKAATPSLHLSPCPSLHPFGSYMLGAFTDAGRLAERHREQVGGTRGMVIKGRLPQCCVAPGAG